jgi:Zn-dependent peptidase ImmA (M78 family)
MAISKYERDQMVPGSDSLIRIAKAVHVRLEYFFRPMEVELGAPEYRKRASLPKKVQARLEADILDQVERFLELVALYPERPFEALKLPKGLPKTIDRIDDVEDVALALRKAWDLGLNAIADLVPILETHGILVLTTDIDSGGRFDGLAATVGGYPLIVVAADWPGDRQRFTLAHELGHLVLHGRLAEDIKEEAACNRFAGAFLVPREQILLSLGRHRRHLEPRELYLLKHEWGVSMNGLIYRSKDLGILSDSTAGWMFGRFRSRGWHRLEPGDQIASESPQLFEQLVYRALAEEMITHSKAAELQGMTVAALRDRQQWEQPDAPAG